MRGGCVFIPESSLEQDSSSEVTDFIGWGSGGINEVTKVLSFIWEAENQENSAKFSWLRTQAGAALAWMSKLVRKGEWEVCHHKEGFLHMGTPGVRLPHWFPSQAGAASGTSVSSSCCVPEAGAWG